MPYQSILAAFIESRQDRNVANRGFTSFLIEAAKYGISRYSVDSVSGSFDRDHTIKLSGDGKQFSLKLSLKRNLYTVTDGDGINEPIETFIVPYGDIKIEYLDTLSVDNKLVFDGEYMLENDTASTLYSNAEKRAEALYNRIIEVAHDNDDLEAIQKLIPSVEVARQIILALSNALEMMVDPKSKFMQD